MNTPSEEADKHCSLLFCNRPAYRAGVCEGHYVKPDPTPSDLPSGDMEIERIVKDYAWIDTNELGEDKFRGHFNLPEALTALQALQDKKVAEAHKDELRWAIACCEPIRVGEKSAFNVISQMRLKRRLEDLSQLTNKSKGGK